MKRFYAILTVLSLTTGLMASPISKKAAANIAKDFFAQKATNSTNSINGKAAETSVNMAYESDELYVFNGNSGFVVVSSDDQTTPVLGWADGEQFDAQKVNPATKMWLESYKEQIQALKDNGALQTITLSNYAPVAPIVPFKWGQSEPYNKFLPIDKNTKQRSIAGCPAISLAQVMATLKYPNAAMLRGIPAQSMYEGNDNQRELIQQLEALPATTFDWTKMKEKFDPEDKTDAPNEVAKLIKYAGYAQGITYTSEWSSGWDAAAFEAARLYFGYNEVKLLPRNTCAYSDFEKVIYDELKEGRPVIYTASSLNVKKSELGGHSFIVDGYNQGYYHINWGWNGDSDGYFVLSVLNSQESGEKGAKVANGYNIIAKVLYGFKKPTTVDPADGVNILGISGVDLMDKETTNLGWIELTRSSDEEDFPAFIEGVQFDKEISPYIDKEYDIAWNLYDVVKKEYVFTEPKVRLLESVFLSGERRRMQFNVTIPNDVEDGDYQVHWLFRDCKGEKNTDKWYPCLLSDVYCAELTVKGNKMTVWPSFDEYTRAGDTKINSVTIDGEGKVYQTVTLKFNATNYSNSQSKPIYLWASNDGKKYTLCSGTGMNIDKKMSGDFYLTFSPETAGLWYIALLDRYTGDYNPNDNFLSEEQSEIIVKGTSLSYKVTNIEEDDDDDEDDNEEWLLNNSVLGQYMMNTSDKAPCTKTMYIILKEYNDETGKYEYSTDPNDKFNKKVVCDFEKDEPVYGEFSFPDLKEKVSYQLSVGELVNGEVEAIYDYPSTYVYKSQGPSAVSNVKAAEGKTTNIYFDLSGRRIEGKPTQKGLYIHDGKVEVVQ